MGIWRDAPGYDEYQVSSEGNIKSLKCGREKLLKLGVDKDGYLQVSLWKDGKRKMKKVHRLVAKAFIPNPLGLPQVNHKDEDKTNNRVENLEWCTHEYNMNYGTRIERTSKKVYQYTLDGRLIKIWPSAAEAGRNGFNAGHITDCCNGKRKTHKGFIWQYGD